MTMTEAPRTKVTIVEVRCAEMIRYAGKDTKCGRLILRLPPDLMQTVAEYVARAGCGPEWWCDKHNRIVEVETRQVSCG